MFDSTMAYSSDYLPTLKPTPILNDEIATKILRRCANDMQFTRITLSPIGITSAAIPDYSNIVNKKNVSVEVLINNFKKYSGSHFVIYANGTIIMKAMAHKDTAGMYAYKIMVNYYDGLDFYNRDTYYVSLLDMIYALYECVDYSTNSELIENDCLNFIMVESEYTGCYFPLVTYIVEDVKVHSSSYHPRSFDPKPGSNYRGD